MITVNDVGLQSPDRKLFEEVNVKFIPGNCYGLIGANGAGKSTFLKILSGEIQPTTDVVSTGPNERLATLKQNHFDYEDYTVLETVIMRHRRLYEVMKEKDVVYMKEDFSDEDRIRATELEGEFAELDGWGTEPEAVVLLQGLNIPEELYDQRMSELTAGRKVKALLAQSLFSRPDVLLLDESTNGLDTRSINWLEEFLINLENTVIVVSHDRHFLNKVCTHMADLDFSKIKLYVGNYDFWLRSSQLATKLQAQPNVKKEEQIKELQDFIAHSSANASKSKQATSRRKMLDKITLDDIQPSPRRHLLVGFTPEREIGNDLLQAENVSATIDGEEILDNISSNLTKGNKVAFTVDSDITTTTLFKVIMGKITPDTGSVRWGVTISQAYLSKNNSKDFEEPLTILDWLRQLAGKEEDDNTFLHSFLGRMLFSGEEILKSVDVLSGDEKVRVMLSKLAFSKANVLVLDGPMNHPDLESITTLNDGLMAFTGSILFALHNRQFIQTLANRIIAVSDKGIIDRVETTYDEFLENPEIQKQMDVLFSSDY